MADLSAFQTWIADCARTLGEQATHLTDLDRAAREGISFKQTPYALEM